MTDRRLLAVDVPHLGDRSAMTRPEADIARLRDHRRALLGDRDTPMVEVDLEGRTVFVGGDWFDLAGATRPGERAVDVLLGLVDDADAVIEAAIEARLKEKTASFVLARAGFEDRRIFVVPIPQPGDRRSDHGAAFHQESHVLIGLSSETEIGDLDSDSARRPQLSDLLSGEISSPDLSSQPGDSEPGHPGPDGAPGSDPSPGGDIDQGMDQGHRSWRHRYGTIPALAPGVSSLAVGLAVAATAVLLWRLSRLDPFADDFTLSTALWIFAFAALYLGVRTAPTNAPPRLAAAPLLTRAALIGVVFVALLFRIVDLDSIPFVLFGDEAEQGLEARRVISGEIRSPFWTGWLGVPTMSFFYHSLGLRIFGDDVFGLRMPWALVGVATVPFTYLLGRRLSGSTRFGLVSAALVATYHFHVHYSRLGSVQISDAIFLVVALWLLHRAFDLNRGQDWLACGGVSGLAMFFYAGARLTIVIVTAVFVYRYICVRGDFWRRYRRGLALLWAGFAIVAAPMLQFAITHWVEFNARLNEVSVIGSRWVDEQHALGRSDLDIWWQQLVRSLLAFNRYEDTTVWYGLRQPLLDTFFGIIFLIGLGWSTVRVFRFRDERYAPLVAWWWGGMLTGGFLTLHPPSSQRLVTLTVPTVMLVAVGLLIVCGWLFRLGQWVSTRLPPSPVATIAPWFTVRRVLAVAVLAFGLVSWKTYFVDHPRDRFGAGHSALGSAMAEPLNALDRGTHVWFVGEPFVYWRYGTMQFLIGAEKGEDLGQDQMNTAFLSTLGRGQTEIPFVVAVERHTDLDLIRSVWPRGETHELLTSEGHLMGTLYIARTDEEGQPPSRHVDTSVLDVPSAVAVGDGQIWRQMGIDGLAEVRGIDATPTGGAILVDVNGLVVEVDDQGRAISVVDVTDGEAEFTDVVVDANGVAWLADARNARLYRLGAQGSLASVPADPAALNWARGIGDGNDGTLWAASPVSARVTQLATDGTTITVFEAPGRQPVDVAIAPDGAVWVVDAERIELVKYSPAGDELAVVALPGFTSVEAPHLAVFGAELWITDPEDSTVRRLNVADGEPIDGPIDIGRGGGGGVDKAVGIGVGPDGRVWIVDAKAAALTITTPG